MPQKRTLPDEHNPLLEDEHTPPLEILIERRRLGQTDLHVKPGQVGLNNATKAENLGIFDYAHLRVPLPPNLKGSEIFKVAKHTPYPESYFLMRRSSDGYISATGMFKAAFPWATADEEQNERKHHKTLPTAGHEEVAGNVWISPEHALELASEYHMRAWVIALLDPSPIELGTKDKSSNNNISSPPSFKLSEKDKMFSAPNLSASTLRKRELRSASPSKSQARKIATPRKRRTKASKADDDKGAHAQLGNGTAGSASVEPTPSVVSEQQGDDVVRVEVDETVEKKDDVETTHTTVQISMPAGHKDLKLPDTAEGVLETSHDIVTEARRLEKSKSSKKRKAEVFEEEEDEEEEVAPVVAQPAKRQRVLEEQLKVERVKARALIGITTAVAIGTMATYFF